MTRIATSLAVLMLAAVPVANAATEQDGGNESLDMSVYDTNDDGTVTAEEFDEGVSEADIITYYDTDGDGRVDRAELTQMIFVNADTNQDGEIDSDELEAFDDLSGRSIGTEVSQ